MTRADIIQRFHSLALPADACWLVTGGAMVLYGLRAATEDIDLGCTAPLADRLEREGYPTRLLADGTRRITLCEDVELFEEWLYDRIEQVGGIPVISLRGLLEMKRRLGREKDREDIARIEAALSRSERREECSGSS